MDNHVSHCLLSTAPRKYVTIRCARRRPACNPPGWWRLLRDLGVARRRRCYRIASSSLLDLAGKRHQRMVTDFRGAVLSALIALLMSAEASAHHQNRPENYDRIIVPILSEAVISGAGGTQWATTLTVHNSGAVPVEVTGGPSTGHVAACPPQPCRVFLSGGQTTRIGYKGLASNLQIYNPWADRFPGLMVYVEKPHSPSIHFDLQLYELSRGNSVELPVIRESDFRTSTIILPDVPVIENHRIALRIYDGDYSDSDRIVVVRVFPYGSNNLIAQSEFELQRPFPQNPLQLSVWPGYASITDLVGAFPALGDFESIRIEVEPLTPNLRFWAFASVTSNTTQRVRLFRPQ